MIIRTTMINALPKKAENIDAIILFDQPLDWIRASYGPSTVSTNFTHKPINRSTKAVFVNWTHSKKLLRVIRSIKTLQNVDKRQPQAMAFFQCANMFMLAFMNRQDRVQAPPSDSFLETAHNQTVGAQKLSIQRKTSIRLTYVRLKA